MAPGRSGPGFGLEEDRRALPSRSPAQRSSVLSSRNSRGCVGRPTRFFWAEMQGFAWLAFRIPSDFYRRLLTSSRPASCAGFGFSDGFGPFCLFSDVASAVTLTMTLDEIFSARIPHDRNVRGSVSELSRSAGAQARVTAGFQCVVLCRRHWGTWFCNGEILSDAADPKPLPFLTRLILRVPGSG